MRTPFAHWRHVRIVLLLGFAPFGVLRRRWLY